MITTKKEFSDPILIGIFSLFSYLVAYSYEMGICIYFNIPFFLIEVKLTSTLLIGAIIYCTGYFVGGIGATGLHFILAFSDVSLPKLRRIIFLIIWAIAIWMPICDVLLKYLVTIWAMIVAFLITIILEFILIKLLDKSFLRYKSQYSLSADQPSPIAKSVNFMRLYNMNVAIVLFTFFSPMLFLIIGYYKCVFQRKYLSNGHSIIIRKYEGNYIAKTFDKNTRKLTDSLQLINEGDIVGYYKTESVKTNNESVKILAILSEQISSD